MRYGLLRTSTEVAILRDGEPYLWVPRNRINYARSVVAQLNHLQRSGSAHPMLQELMKYPQVERAINPYRPRNRRRFSIWHPALMIGIVLFLYYFWAHVWEAVKWLITALKAMGD